MREIGFDPKLALATAAATGVGGTSAAKAAGAAGAAGAASGDFAASLKAALDGVNASQKHAEALSRAYQLEDPKVGLEETMIASAKANVEFQTLIQVRNRLVSAYHDIMNMPV